MDWHSKVRASVWCACLAAVSGCTSTKVSDTARTGTEQLLISNAVDQALLCVDFSPFALHKVFLDDKYLDCVDKSYVIGSIHHKLLIASCELVPKLEDADIVLEVRSGGVGTDSSQSFLGSPAISVPGLTPLPEIKLISRNTQWGTAKLGLVAYDAKSHLILGLGGTALARSVDSKFYFLGAGPYRTGSVENELSQSGVSEEGLTNIPSANQIYFEATAAGPGIHVPPAPVPPAAPADKPGQATVDGKSAVDASEP